MDGSWMTTRITLISRLDSWSRDIIKGNPMGNNRENLSDGKMG
jgi:hypothetical protein